MGGCQLTVLENFDTWREKSQTDAWARNSFNYLESVLFETKLVFGCVCMCMHVCVAGEGWRSALVILNQVIAVFRWTPALPLSPGDSSVFRWAYLSTHKPWHSQVVVYWAESLSAFRQSVSITDVLSAVVFLFHSRHSHSPYSFLYRGTKRLKKIIKCSVQKKKAMPEGQLKSFLVFSIWPKVFVNF